jgi:hypothetical protein
MDDDELAELRLKVLAFRSHVFGTSDLPPITPDPAIKKLVIQVLRSDLSLTKTTIDKLPPTARTYIAVALNHFEINLQKVRNNNDLVRIFMAPCVIQETTPKVLSATISAVLADVIDKSIGPCAVSS